jgi:sec-independent protein translocase protein TatA
MAQGIKAFKKGMQDDDKTADAPVKSIDHQQPDAAQPNADLKQRAETERKFEGTAS